MAHSEDCLRDWIHSIKNPQNIKLYTYNEEKTSALDLTITKEESDEKK
jgi:hypothetical protein